MTLPGWRQKVLPLGIIPVGPLDANFTRPHQIPVALLSVYFSFL